MSEEEDLVDKFNEVRDETIFKEIKDLDRLTTVENNYLFLVEDPISETKTIRYENLINKISHDAYEKLKDTITTYVDDNSRNKILPIDLKTDDLTAIANKLWANLDKLMVLGEKRDFIFLNPLLQAFINAKSPKFSFLKGEKASEGSLFDVFPDGKGLEPDIRGASPRNLAQGSNRDLERIPGHYQDDALQNIKGNAWGALSDENWQSGGALWNEDSHPEKKIAFGGHHWRMGTIYFDASKSVRTSHETRGKNFAVLSVVKILP